MGSNGDDLDNTQTQSSIPQDLKVTIKRFSIVLPFEETERKTFFLSNIDQLLNFDVETIHFFGANQDFPPEIVVEKLEYAYRKILVHYDFLAGRLRWTNQNQDEDKNGGRSRPRLEIYCNSARAGFAVASSELTLADLGELMYPNPAFQQLVVKNSNSPQNMDQQLLCAIQVTFFKCGGFALGIFTNHAAFDGISFKLFLENLASSAANRPMLALPYHNGGLLAARSPPRVTFSHPELVIGHKIASSTKDQEKENYSSDHSYKSLFESTSENLVFKIFRLSSEDISKLKEKARMSNNNNKNSNNIISSFSVVTTHIWRCKTLAGIPQLSSSLNTSENEWKKKISTFLYAVDLRPKLIPPLPKTFTGNAILNAYARASYEELEEGPFGHLVELVSKGASRLTDEYIRSVIDWGEIHYGYPNDDLLVSSWWKLGFSKVNYPWGRPKYSCPIVYHKKDIILLFPDNEIEGAGTVNDGKGVNVLVALPNKEMEEFQRLFFKFLI